MPFRQREIPQRYNPATGPASGCRSYMLDSMDSISSEDCFTQVDYNQIMIIMSYMDSEGAVEPAIFSEKTNYDEDSPTLTESMAGEEVG